jgi:choline-sulfatase
MVEMVDAEVGRILDALDQSPWRDNTLIVFMSDHGEGVAEHRMTRKNYGYEASIRVPLAFSFPGRVPEGRSNAADVTSLLDLVPTLCDYAGESPPGDMRGANLRPLIEGRSAPARDRVAVELSSRRAQALRTERHKYVIFRDDPLEQLFDLRDDPGETRNLAVEPAHRENVERHRRMLGELRNGLSVHASLREDEQYWRSRLSS